MLLTTTNDSLIIKADKKEVAKHEEEKENTKRYRANSLYCGIDNIYFNSNILVFEPVQIK